MKHRSLIKIAALAIAVSAALPALADTTVVSTGKHHYVYFGDHDIYYAPETKTYFWLDNGRWQSGYSLPEDRRAYVTARGVDIELDTDRPFERNDYVIEHYRHAPVVATGPANETVTTERSVNPDGSTTTTTTTTKHRYMYFADRDVYFAPDTRTYYWLDNGRWVSGTTVPPQIEPFVRSGGVEIELDTARPYERNEYVIAHYGHRHHHDDD
jgi:hypothetical protein